MDSAGPVERRLRIGVTQWHATADMAGNLEVALRMIDRAASEGAEIVLLPENCLCLGDNEEMRAHAIAVESREVSALRHAAQEARSAVVLGGFKRRAADGHVYNSELVIGCDGDIVGTYDKIHLFDAKISGREFHASAVEEPGHAGALLVMKGITIGLTICYDVRFPELFRTLALHGAEVLLVPSAFMYATGIAHWEVLLRARAIENGAYVVASATVRESSEEPVPTYGHALVVDPWGRVAVDLGEELDALRVVDLDLRDVAAARTALPVLRQVRPDAYAAEPETLVAGGGR